MQARRLPARHGFLWLIASFDLFRSNPPLITTLSLGYLFLVVVLHQLAPIGPFLLTLALPALVVILANGCRTVQRGGGVGAIALTYGLKSCRVQLLTLGGLLLVGMIVVIAVILVINGESLSISGDAAAMSEEEKSRLFFQLLVILLPVVAGFWFAPLLVAWDSIAPSKAVFFSFVAVWRNWRAFLVYLLVSSTLAIAIPELIRLGASAISEALEKPVAISIHMILLFVVWPITTSGVFVSYQDVFHGEAAGE